MRFLRATRFLTVTLLCASTACATSAAAVTSQLNNPRALTASGPATLLESPRALTSPGPATLLDDPRALTASGPAILLDGPRVLAVPDPDAHVAKIISFVENASLTLTGSHESTLIEAGSAHGTYNCRVTGSFTIKSNNHVTATFTVYPKDGSITGHANARLEVAGKIAYYGGTMTITGGTGAYHHAHASAIGISGTINRRTYAATVKTNGTAHI